MRLFLLLLITLGFIALFTLFPNFISQPVHLEAFGWVFETQQGAFIALLLLLLATLWLLQRIITAIFAGPGQLWRTLRIGGKKRREQRLKEGVAEFLDMRGDQGRRAFGKARGVVPDWASAMLKTLTIPANEQPLPEDSPSLNSVLAARIATDPNAPSKPDAATRKAHLEAWLTAHPDAPLAISRMAALAEEESDWKSAVELLEKSWKQGQRSAATVKPRLAHAYVQLAATENREKLNYLRKAQRLLPDDKAALLALGQAYLDDNNPSAAEKLWLGYLESHNDFDIASALLLSMEHEALQAFRRLDKKDAPSTYNPAMRWLQASLAQAAGLIGLANEIIDELMQREPCDVVLRSRAEWHAEAGEWQEAADCYRQLCDQTAEQSADQPNESDQ